jgi:hypothetical protein
MGCFEQEIDNIEHLEREIGSCHVDAQLEIESRAVWSKGEKHLSG